MCASLVFNLSTIDKIKKQTSFNKPKVNIITEYAYGFMDFNEITSTRDKLDYFIKFNGVVYKIRERDYNTVNAVNLYATKPVNGKKLMIVKNKGIYYNNNNYLPFSPGIKYSGSIVEINGVIRFSIRNAIKEEFSSDINKKWLKFYE